MPAYDPARRRRVGMEGVGMTETSDEPRRLTPTERLHEVTLAALARRPAAPESSVAISRNAKGVAQFEVTVRGEVLAEVLRDATATFDELCESYPYPSANDAG